MLVIQHIACVKSGILHIKWR